MKRIFYCFVFCRLLFSACIAHPGIGIVKDSKGNIFYTDLEQVWKITPVGTKTIVVHNVHTHELYMDRRDNLYGEHLWYNGEQLDTWGHYVWRLSNDGSLVKEKGPAKGFLSDYSFNRDSAGNMYWADRSVVSSFKMKTTDGSIRTIAEGKFRDIRWIHVTEDGTLYFTDLTDLYKIEKGKVILLAKDLEEHTRIFGYTSLKHNVYGIWLDKNNNVYVAIAGGQVVKKITRQGKVSNFVYSPGNWAPNGGIFDKEGNLWLLENNILNKVRVRKIQPAEFNKPLPASVDFTRKIFPFLIVSASIAIPASLLFFTIRRITRKKRNDGKQLLLA